MRSALEKFAAVQMIDVHLPTTDGRELLLTRHTQPEARTPAPDPTAQAPIATTAATAHRHRLRPSPPAVVQTLPANPLIGNGCGTENPANPRRRTSYQ